MSQISKGIFGALAIGLVGLTCGAVQFASGHDLVGGKKVVAAAAAQSGVNRAAKGDRDPLAATARKGETIALRLDSLGDTSVLVRLPAAKSEARSGQTPMPVLKSGERRNVACEPVVSVLTEVAKQLQPGRCVT